MAFSNEDKHVIKFFRLAKGYSAKQLSKIISQIAVPTWRIKPSYLKN